MKLGRRLALVAASAAVVAAPAAVAARTGGSVDQRSKTIVFLLRKCSNGVSLAFTVATSGGSDVQVSEAVNLVKGGCNSYRDKVISLSSSGGLGSAREDAFTALDYWARGLGRVSNYIDNSKPSDLVTAKQYFATARSFQHQAIAELNRARAAAGLTPIAFKNGI